MSAVQITQQLIEKLHKFHRRLIVELHQTEIAHERRSVQCVNDLLDLSSVYKKRYS